MARVIIARPIPATATGPEHLRSLEQVMDWMELYASDVQFLDLQRRSLSNYQTRVRAEQEARRRRMRNLGQVRLILSNA
ncbi:MAG: hypothetical protein MMC23_001263 [Stictis urceolatum]|nr:hypothetical protein [Stictis urceolata]